MNDLRDRMDEYLMKMENSVMFSKEWRDAEDSFLRNLINQSYFFKPWEIRHYDERYEKIMGVSPQ